MSKHWFRANDNMQTNKNTLLKGEKEGETKGLHPLVQIWFTCSSEPPTIPLPPCIIPSFLTTFHLPWRKENWSYLWKNVGITGRGSDILLSVLLTDSTHNGRRNVNGPLPQPYLLLFYTGYKLSLGEITGGSQWEEFHLYCSLAIKGGQEICFERKEWFV